jgi:hypothetical protein
MPSIRTHPITLLCIAALLASCSAPPQPTNAACLPPQGATGVFVSESGDDTSGDGSLAAPYRSLTQALAAAPLGATIHVLCGTFSDTHGEAFPLDVSGRAIAGVGATLASVVYEGADVNTVALVAFSGDVSVTGLTLSGFTGNTIDVAGGTASIEDVRIVSSVSGDGDGSGIRLDGGAVAELLRVDITGGDEGVSIGDFAAVRVVDSVIRGARGDGIDIGDAASLFVRGTRITGSASSGVEIGSPSSIDLGTADDPGGNTITGNAEWQIQDRRAAFAGTTIMAIGNDLGTPVSGVQTGPSSLAQVWEIRNDGNQIDFGGP